MNEAALATVVALTRVDPRPPHHLAEDLDSGIDPRLLLERALSTDAGGQIVLAPTHEAPVLIKAAHGDLAAWARDGIVATSVLDPGYPMNLRAVHDRPPLVFSRGRLDQLSSHAVAVIGSRTPTDAGVARTHLAVGHLVAAGCTIVSGLAAGIDTTAHTAALDAGGATAAVIGTGLRHSYPSENAALQADIAARGVVLCPFEPDTPPSRDTFPIRNGTMSGISLASVIVEAGEHSGTRIQARLALGHGRAVFVAAELLDQSWARELAARPGVHPFDTVKQITDWLESRVAATPRAG